MLNAEYSRQLLESGHRTHMIHRIGACTGAWAKGHGHTGTGTSTQHRGTHKTHFSCAAGGALCGVSGAAALPDRVLARVQGRPVGRRRFFPQEHGFAGQERGSLASGSAGIGRGSAHADGCPQTLGSRRFVGATLPRTGGIDLRVH